VGRLQDSPQDREVVVHRLGSEAGLELGALVGLDLPLLDDVEALPPEKGKQVMLEDRYVAMNSSANTARVSA
jgi:hypothetical protein